MRRSIGLMCVLVSSSFAAGQESETTQTSGGTDLISQLWSFEDATPLEAGKMELRFTGRWATGQQLGDSSDDFSFHPSLVWGVAENFELSLTNNIFLGDGGDMGPFVDGNYDTDLGVLWRLHEQVGFELKDAYYHLPSIALSSTFRIPTGDGSSGVDAELRLIMTYEYENGIRTHLNVFGKSVNGDNFDIDNINPDNFDDFGSHGFFGTSDGESLNSRDFQYGGVIGADGPLCHDGAVRWVADYMYRSSAFDGFSFMHVGEVGWEWDISEASKLGFSVQASLDHNASQHDWGAGFAYTQALAY